MGRVSPCGTVTYVGFGRLFLFDDSAALVGGVFADVVGARGGGVVHHRHDRHTEVHAQAVDDEEPEERQHGQHQPARRKLYPTKFLV